MEERILKSRSAARLTQKYSATASQEEIWRKFTGPFTHGDASSVHRLTSGLRKLDGSDFNGNIKTGDKFNGHPFRFEITEWQPNNRLSYWEYEFEYPENPKAQRALVSLSLQDLSDGGYELTLIRKDHGYFDNILRRMISSAGDSAKRELDYLYGRFNAVPNSSTGLQSQTIDRDDSLREDLHY